MGPSTWAWRVAAMSIGGAVLVTAQTPTQTWTPAPACTNGLPNPMGMNGTYVDDFGATWAVECAQDSSGFVYDPQEGTNGEGVYACFMGCDKRPGCTAFTYTGTATGAHTGAGKCGYKYSAGTYSLNSTVYAAANLISNGTPQQPCPYYNGSTFTDTNSVIYSVYCSYDGGGGASVGAVNTYDMRGCMLACDSHSGCTSFSYTYGGAEPGYAASSGNTGTGGTCYLKSGTVNLAPNQSNIAVAVSVGTMTGTSTAVPTSSSPPTSSSSSSSSSAAASSSSPSPSSSSSSSSSSSVSSSSVSAYTGPTTTTTQTTTTTTQTTTTTTQNTTTTALTTTTTTTSTSSVSSSMMSTSAAASSSASCAAAPYPSAPACTGSSGLLGSFRDACGTNYTVYCSSDTNPGSVATLNANSIAQCMQLCDNYPGCRSATLGETACYIKTGFTGVVSSGNTGLAALVRYIPPNPNYAAPAQAPCTNCSTGCGSALPAGLTPNGASVLFNFLNPSDGLNRNYTIHIPQLYDINHASPVIFAFPGNGESASNIEAETGMSDGVTNPYAIMVYVNGWALGFESNPAWAPGGQYSYVDDIGFIKNLITNMTQTFCVDTGRIFATGHSNGGGFVNLAACDPVLSVKFAAFAGNSAACYTNATSGNPSTLEPLNTPVQALCSPGRNNVPFLEIHGTSDGVIAYTGGGRNGRILPTIPHLVTDWATRQGMDSSNYTTTPGNNITLYQFGGNSGQLGIVTHYMLGGWVHAWAIAANGAPMDGTPVIMNFFYNWTNPNRQAQYYPPSSSSSSSVSSSTVSSSTVSSTVSTTTVSTTSSSSSSGSSSASASSSSFSSVSSTVSSTLSPSSSGSSTVSSTSSSTQTMTSQSSTSLSSGSTSISSTLSSGSSSSSATSSGVNSSSVLTASSSPPSTQTSTAPSSSSSSSSSSASSSRASTSSPSSSAASSSMSTTAQMTTTTTMVPGSTQSSTGTSSSLTSTASASASASAGPSCPANNGQTVADSAGVQYMIGCGSDTFPGSYTSHAATNSFNDCFPFCDNSQSIDAQSCVGFTYHGGPNGVGPGTCYMKSTAGSGFIAAPDNNYVAVIRAGSGATSSSSPAAALSTSTSAAGASASSSTSASSMSTSSTAGISSTSSSTWSTTSLSTSSVGMPAPYSTAMSVGTTSTQPSSSSAVSSSSASPSPIGPLCPAANGTTYTDTSGNQYMILCDYNTEPGSFNSTYTADFRSCINACHSYASCVAVSYVGQACYFKASYTGGESAPGTGSAVLLSVYNGQTVSSVAMMSSTSSQAMVSSTSAGAHSSSAASSSAAGVLSTNSSSPVGSSTMPSPASSSTVNVISSSSQMSSTPSVMLSSNGQSSSTPAAMASSSTQTSSTPGAVMLSSSQLSSTAGLAMSSSNPPSSTPASMASSTKTSTSTSSSVASSGAVAFSTPASSPNNPPPGYGSTTSAPQSTSPASSTTSPASSSTTPLPACPSQACGTQSTNHTSCADAYGNNFNVRCGTVYQGTITVRAVQPNVGACLTQCDTTAGCVAINYIGMECQILTVVTGNTTEPDSGAAAATRPADVSTVYTAPSSSTSSSMMATGMPASNGASMTMPGYGAGSSGPGPSPGAGTVSMTGGSGAMPGQSTANNGGGNPYSPIASTIYMSSGAGGSSSTMMLTMANPTYSVSAGGSGGAGGPGPVSGGNSGISTGVTGSSSGGMVTGPASYGSMSGNPSATMTGSNPASTGPVCPNYDGEQYTDPQGNAYDIQCNTAYTGTVITTSNSTMGGMYKRQSSSSEKACMDYCDQTSGCTAIVVDCDGGCTLYGSVTGSMSGTYCGLAAMRAAGPASPGSGTVSTVTVCAASRTGTTTVFTTSTLTTCAANQQCTMGSGLIGRQIEFG